MTSEAAFRIEYLRRGIKMGELHADGDVTITMQTSGMVKTDLSGVFAAEPGFDPLTDRIRPLYLLSGEWIPLGQYVVNDLSRPYHDGYGQMDIKALDFGHFVERHPAEERPYFQAGELYTEVVMRLLDECGIMRVRLQESPLRLRNNREDWEIGTSTLAIINQLLSEINYDDLWFDAGGYARIGQVDISGPALHEYKAGDRSIIDCAYAKSLDVNGAYNVFKAYVSAAEGEPMMAAAENNDPASSISTVRIGRNVLLEKLTDIASQEELDQYVQRKRNRSMSGTERVTYTTAIRPHGVGDTVYLQHHEMHGVYRETGWTITLDGQMTHEAEKVVLL